MNVFIVTGLSAYLLGSIPVGYVLMKWVKDIDIRTIGSGNIGMTNVWRAAGWRWGIVVLLLDIAKGALAVWAPIFLLQGHPQLLELRVEGGLFVMLGNIFPLFLRFKGGKGVGVAIGIFFSLLPQPTFAALVVFGATVYMTRMISAGSLMATLTLTAVTWITRRPWDVLSLFTVLAAAVVWWTHRTNIQRILSGSENRIGRNHAKKRGSRNIVRAKGAS